MISRYLANVSGSISKVETSTSKTRSALPAASVSPHSSQTTVVRPGREYSLWSKDHVEAVYCLEGEGEVAESATGKTSGISAGTILPLGPSGFHVLKASRGVPVRFLCVTNPTFPGAQTGRG